MLTALHLGATDTSSVSELKERVDGIVSSHLGSPERQILPPLRPRNRKMSASG